MTVSRRPNESRLTCTQCEGLRRLFPRTVQSPNLARAYALEARTALAIRNSNLSRSSLSRSSSHSASRSSSQRRRRKRSLSLRKGDTPFDAVANARADAVEAFLPKSVPFSKVPSHGEGRSESASLKRRNSVWTRGSRRSSPRRGSNGAAAPTTSSPASPRPPTRQRPVSEWDQISPDLPLGRARERAGTIDGPRRASPTHLRKIQIGILIRESRLITSSLAGERAERPTDG